MGKTPSDEREGEGPGQGCWKPEIQSTTPVEIAWQFVEHLLIDLKALVEAFRP